MGADAARRLAADGYRDGILSSSGKSEALERPIDGAVECWGRIDVLVNSAGHGPKGPVLELSDEDWHEGLEVCLLNVIRASRLVVTGQNLRIDGGLTRAV